MSTIRKKVKERTATIEEYRNLKMTERLNARRKKAVEDFWREEKQRILNSQPTRDWTESQKAEILSGHAPKFMGKTIQGHHTYSVSRYPHLSANHEVIYPVTFDEHLYGWHGGNFKNSLPGKPIKRIKKF